ncbi:MAG: dephospho-CoA kinase [Acidimicrobiia bacterium]
MTAGKRRWVLSGGMASGKSTVRRLLERHRVVTIDADSVGHWVLESDGPAFADVAARWPHVVEEGEIRRQALASVVFNDRDELEVLESITHPHIFDTIRAKVEEIDSPVVVEIPLLSHGLGDDWSRIVVDIDPVTQLERALGKGMDPDDARARLGAQPSREQWLAKADLVIPNHGTVEDLEQAVRLVAVVL